MLEWQGIRRYHTTNYYTLHSTQPGERCIFYIRRCWGVTEHTHILILYRLKTFIQSVQPGRTCTCVFYLWRLDWTHLTHILWKQLQSAQPGETHTLFLNVLEWLRIQRYHTTNYYTHQSAQPGETCIFYITIRWSG